MQFIYHPRLNLVVELLQHSYPSTFIRILVEKICFFGDSRATGLIKWQCRAYSTFMSKEVVFRDHGLVRIRPDIT